MRGTSRSNDGRAQQNALSRYSVVQNRFAVARNAGILSIPHWRLKLHPLTTRRNLPTTPVQRKQQFLLYRTTTRSSSANHYFVNWCPSSLSMILSYRTARVRRAKYRAGARRASNTAFSPFRCHSDYCRNRISVRHDRMVRYSHPQPTTSSRHGARAIGGRSRGW